MPSAGSAEIPRCRRPGALWSRLRLICLLLSCGLAVTSCSVVSSIRPESRPAPSQGHRSCVAAVRTWLTGQDGKWFRRAESRSNTTWAAARKGATAVEALAQPFNTAAGKADTIPLPACISAADYHLAMGDWMLASVSAAGGQVKATRSEIAQGNGYLAEIAALRADLPEITAHATTPTSVVSCKTLHWPRPVPARVIGRLLGSPALGDLWCFNVIAAYNGHGGHNILGDPANSLICQCR
jgi:hypothetical protein